MKYLLLITVISSTSFGQTFTIDHTFPTRKECLEYGELIKELSWQKEVSYACKKAKGRTR